MKTVKINKLWENTLYDVKGKVFTKELFKKYLNIFWKEVVESIPQDKHIILLFRINLENGDIKTLCNLQKLNKEDKQYFYEFVLSYISLINEKYTFEPAKYFIFSYGIRNGLAESKTISGKNKVNKQTYKNKDLPITMEPEDFGKIVSHKDNEYTIILDNKDFVILTKYDDRNEGVYYKDGENMFYWKDYYLTENSFKRVIAKITYIFKDEILILKQVEKPVKFITKGTLERLRQT